LILSSPFSLHFAVFIENNLRLPIWVVQGHVNVFDLCSKFRGSFGGGLVRLPAVETETQVSYLH
jgi:hypothetical protein